MNWTKMTSILPDEGYTGIILCKNGTNDNEFWTYDIATYCDGTWYCLELDHLLGVLRKQPVSEEVFAYANYTIPEYDDWIKKEYS